MNLPCSIAFCERQLRLNREQAARLSLAGWPGEANHHRRLALWCVRQLRRLAAWAKVHTS